VADAWVEVERFVGSDTTESDFFGAAVAVSGDTAIVGASLDDDLGVGSAYVFQRNLDGGWVETQKLLPMDGSSFFGGAVAISGDIAIIAANADDDNGDLSGAAYVFERDSDDTWVETQKLLAPDGEIGDSFGISVAISADWAIIGAELDDDAGPQRGSAYLFERTAEGVWVAAQKLLPSDGSMQDYFGSSVSIQGDTAIVGAVVGDAAYVFEREPSGTWLETQTLAPVGGGPSPGFGSCVAISDDTVIVGSNKDSIDNSGAVYVLERDLDGIWVASQKLLASDGEGGDWFGSECAISGDRLVVGSYLNDFDAGSAYVFERGADGVWLEVQNLLASDGEMNDLFGDAVAISATTVFVGARVKDLVGTNSGAGYIFEKIPFVDPTLTFTGDCPGDVSSSTSFLTPNSQGTTYRSEALGSFVIEEGPCAGLELSLETPSRGPAFTTDALGRRRATANLTGDQCGTYLQVVDLESCLVSDAVQTP